MAKRNYTKTGWTAKPKSEYSPCPQCEMRRLGIQPKPRIVFLLGCSFSDDHPYAVHAKPVFSFAKFTRPDIVSSALMGNYQTREEALDAIETEAKHYYEFTIFE